MISLIYVDRVTPVLLSDRPNTRFINFLLIYTDLFYLFIAIHSEPQIKSEIMVNKPVHFLLLKVS